jgi:hypothetical protein
VAVDAANVREEPTTESHVIAKFKRGYLVLLNGAADEPGWVRVSFRGESGTQAGYMALSTLKISTLSFKEDEEEERNYSESEFLASGKPTELKCGESAIYSSRFDCEVGVAVHVSGPYEYSGWVSADCSAKVEFKESRSDYFGSKESGKELVALQFSNGSGIGTGTIEVDEPGYGLRDYKYASLDSLECRVLSLTPY